MKKCRTTHKMSYNVSLWAKLSSFILSISCFHHYADSLLLFLLLLLKY